MPPMLHKSALFSKTSVKNSQGTHYFPSLVAAHYKTLLEDSGAEDCYILQRNKRDPWFPENL